MKKKIIIILTLITVFGGAIFIAYKIKENFKPSCYEQVDLDYTVFNTQFVAREYVEVKDLGKSFLTLLIAVFVASITFSEKIVTLSSSTWWSKCLLFFCWVLLLLSIVLTGAGLVFNASCFNQALYVPCKDNLDLFELVFVCFVLSGLCFGLGLSSMLAAGIISFIHKIDVVKGPN